MVMGVKLKLIMKIFLGVKRQTLMMLDIFEITKMTGFVLTGYKMNGMIILEGILGSYIATTKTNQLPMVQFIIRSLSNFFNLGEAIGLE